MDHQLYGSVILFCFIGNYRASSLCSAKVKGDRGPRTFCSNGPVTKTFSRPGYYFWPPIKIRKCNDLICRHPRECMASRACIVGQWTNIYKCIRCRCIFVATWLYWLVEYVDCQWRVCSRDSNCRAPKKCNKFASVLSYRRDHHANLLFSWNSIRVLEYTSCQCCECNCDLDCTAPKKCNRSSWTRQCLNVGGFCQPGYRWDHRISRCRLIGPIGPPRSSS